MRERKAVSLLTRRSGRGLAAELGVSHAVPASRLRHLHPRHRHFCSSRSARFRPGVAMTAAKPARTYERLAASRAIRREVRAEVGKSASRRPMVGHATAGHCPRRRLRRRRPGDIVAEIKQELQTEMGLLPVQLLRDRRASFVELYSYDNLGKTNYGTAGYLGRGYFITVKHAVVALQDEDERPGARKIQSDEESMYRGKEIPAKVVDTGDADIEVHSGDWAIIKHARSRPAAPARRYRICLRLRRHRSSASATTTRRGSSSRPVTSGSERRTVSSRASPTAILGCRAAASSTSMAIWSASRSAGCRATTASPSSCRFARRCSVRCRPWLNRSQQPCSPRSPRPNIHIARRILRGGGPPYNPACSAGAFCSHCRSHDVPWRRTLCERDARPPRGSSLPTAGSDNSPTPISTVTSTEIQN